jgi:two-component system CheB/CheR fusion protein
LLTASEDFRVVCLGGSAGALEAYVGILRNLPVNTGMAFVVAAHRGPKDANLLAQILGHVTAMPVIEVEQGMLIEPNRVFIMPPGKDMTLHGDEFHLQLKQQPVG